MHKLVIIDDDRIIRKGLTQVFSKRSSGFELVGVETDGERGLELIEKEQPEIVISDINMPFMNGLEMSQKVKEKFPNTKIILLTGYEEFSYAQEAIKLRAFDYVLKPVDSEAILQKARAAAEEWDREHQIQKQITTSLPFLRKEFFTKLLSHTYTEEELDREMEYLDIDISGTYLNTCIIHFDDSGDSSAHKEEAKQILENLLPNSIELVLFDYEKEELVAMISANQKDLITAKKITPYADQARTTIRRELNTTVTITIGEICEDLEEFSHSYQSARAAMEVRHIVGRDRVFSIMDIGIPSKSKEIDLKQFEEELVSKVKLGLTTEVLYALKKFYVKLQEGFIPLQEVRLITIQAMILLYRETEMWDEIVEGDLKSHYDEIHRLQTTEEIMNKLTDIVIHLTKYVNQTREDNTDTVVKRAVIYIERNFSKEGLSLAEVANDVHVSPAYLSNIFKQEKGINFSDFLLKTRMEKAMELLRKEDMKAYEVAEKVGYSNPQYFSVCFKKYTNYSPVSFKKLQ